MKFSLQHPVSIVKREKQTRYLSQAIQLEEAVNPHILRMTMGIISVSVFAFLVWAGCTSIHEVARTPGEVVPAGYQQLVQHLEGGLVRQIHVADGDKVEQGQPLVTLDDAGIREDMEKAESSEREMDMRIERMRAFLEKRRADFSKIKGVTKVMIADQEAWFKGTEEARSKEALIIAKQLQEKKQEVKGLRAGIATTNQNYRLADDVYQRRKSLAAKGYASHIQNLQDEQRVIELQGQKNQLSAQITQAETAVTEYQHRLEALGAGYRDTTHEKLAELEAEKAQNIEGLRKLRERRDRLVIRAPVRGLVKGLAVNTIGGVIQPGQTIMEIVPLDKKLIVQVKIAPQDIGHVQTGQEVRMKFSSYDFARYGFVNGTLDQISATTFVSENGERYYQGRIIPDNAYVGARDNPILPGMTVMADVVTGQKTLLQYLFKPIHTSLQSAFSER